MLTGPPHDGCFIKDTTDVCVTHPDEHLLTFGKASSSLTSSVLYNGTSSRDGNSLHVSSWSASCIDVVDLHGHMLQHLSSNMHLCNPPNLLCALP